MAHQITADTTRFVGDHTGIPALISTMTDAVAAAQLVGTGDASAEIDAVDAAAAALAAAIGALSTAGLAVLFVASDATHNETQDAVELLRFAALNSVARS
jgi:hypothetical protein